MITIAETDNGDVFKALVDDVRTPEGKNKILYVRMNTPLNQEIIRILEKYFIKYK